MLKIEKKRTCSEILYIRRAQAYSEMGEYICNNELQQTDILLIFHK